MHQKQACADLWYQSDHLVLWMLGVLSPDMILRLLIDEKLNQEEKEKKRRLNKERYESYFKVKL